MKGTMELRGALSMAERRPNVGKGESRDQFLDQHMTLWEDNSLRAWSENEQLAEIVACRVCSGLGIGDAGSSRPYDEGGMENEGEGHVSKSRKVEKRRLHKQQQRVNVSVLCHGEAKIL